MQAVGMLLVVALLVAPPAAARLWVTEVFALARLAGALGAVSGFVGVALSATLPNAPAGAVIVLVASALFSASLVLSPTRGLVAVARRRRALARAARAGLAAPATPARARTTTRTEPARRVTTRAS
jgi:manganese/zinc/iron transport system permease protein